MNKQILRNTVLVGLFLVPFIPFLVSSTFFFPFITTKAFVWRTIVEIVFAAWMLLVLLDADYRPRRSVILYSVLGFLIVIGLADLFGVAPVKSFWSNFERMEGYITLLHLGMFFLVISSVFREIDWKRWWNVSLAASFIMVLYSLLQIVGLKTINQGGVRVDGTLGNAIYLAVYMLFHMFIALLFLWREWKNVALRYVYGLLILAQVSVIYFTATRGAILGFLGGLLIVAVLNVSNKEAVYVRKMSITLLCALIILIGGFFFVKDAEFIKNSPVLSRFSSLSVAGLKTQGRYFVWPMAFEGLKERPLLGWGQENFSYVFQEHYSPQMYHLEPWFDRAHNIFLDWAVSGGALGLISYLLLYAALLFSIWKSGVNLSHAEKSVLTGLIAAYFFHNFFVFDHLISYILFFSLLAYLHYRNDGEILLKEKLMPAIQVKAIALPAVAILLVLSLYFVNVKPIIANVFLIEALKSVQTPGEAAVAIGHFQRAYRASRLGRPEVMEQMAANAAAILTSNLPMEEKNAFFSFAKDALLGQAEDKSIEKDARYQILVGSFLSTTGQLDEALLRLERAKELMPNKQAIYAEIANALFHQGDYQGAINTLILLGEISPVHQAEADRYIKEIQALSD